MQGIKIIKNKDLENYKYILYILKELGVKFEEDNDSLKIEGVIENHDKKIIVGNSIKDSNVALIVAMYGLFLNETAEVGKNIEDDFPNLFEFLKNVGLNVNCID